jgi:histidine triad (HIT) family protein
MSDTNCLFCRIASRAAPAEIVAETDGLLAFNDIHPQAPTHLLIIPVEHIRTLADAAERHTPLLGRIVQFANRLAKERGLAEQGYRLVANCGAQAGQSVWHLHWHLLGGRSFTWPPG